MKKIITAVLVGVFFASAVSAEEAKKLFRKYGCDDCHSDYGLVAGPSFYAVKEKYLKKFNGNVEELKKYLYQTIRKGSSGKWFDFMDIKMPAHKHIKEDEMKVIIDHIASLEAPEKTEKENKN
ncbi:c-type cytochrome [Persephonella sp.]